MAIMEDAPRLYGPNLIGFALAARGARRKRGVAARRPCLWRGIPATDVQALFPDEP